jgi:dTDP-4-dehydrorhamnose 3,5-epimerase-like enzyme
MGNMFFSAQTHCTDELKNGALSVIEGERDIPFQIKRVYYTYGVAKDVARGSHAHKTLYQYLFCPYGQIKVILDDGYVKTETLLDNPVKGLVVQPAHWRDLIWEKDNSVLCVLASDYYDEDDYIRDYDQFIKFCEERRQTNEC